MKRAVLAIIPLLMTVALAASVLFAARPVHAAATAPWADSLAYGMPSAPTQWQPAHWDVQTHVRDGYAAGGNDAHLADHGADCSAPPATHPISAWQQAVFVCHDHVMTAIANTGYGEVVLTPDHMADWSQGPVTISYSLSTAMTTARDWFSIGVTPFDKQMSLTFDFGEADLEGMPLQYVNLRTDMSDNAQMRWRVVQESGEDYGRTVGDTGRGLPDLTGIQPSATVRTPFEFTFDSTSYTFRVAPSSPVAPGHVLLSGKFAHPLTFSRGVVQFTHHSYDPPKCDVIHIKCAPDTWHLSDVGISSAVAYTLLRPIDHQVVTQPGGAVSWASPAPTGAFLKFAGIGAIAVSYDGGKSYHRPQRAPADAQYSGHDEHFANYFDPVPAGVSRVLFKVSGGWFGSGMARDFSIVSQSVQNGTPPPSPTATPAPPTLTPAPTPSPAPYDGPCTVVLNDQPVSGICHGTFQPLFP